MSKSTNMNSRHFKKFGNFHTLVCITLTLFFSYSFISYFSSLNIEISIQHDFITPFASGVTQTLFSNDIVIIIDDNFCHLPKLEPFDKSILMYFEKVDPIDCTKNVESPYELLFSITRHGMLTPEQQHSDSNVSECCFIPILDPKNISWCEELCKKIEGPVQLELEHEFLGIFCLKKSTALIPELVDLLCYTPIKPELEASLTKIAENRSRSNKSHQMNVIVFGIDAVSHLNFQRTMPESRNYLLNTMGAHFLNGYTKVADNTFPNLVPVLTGMDVDELIHHCWPTKKSYFDSCPFIWKNFSSEGYRTSYGEDAVWMGTFTYQKKGFQNPPTDYYLTDFMLSSATNIGHWKDINAKLCYGPRLAFSILLDNMEKLAVTMGSERPYFQFTWATSLTHDSLNYPGIVDDQFKSSLEFLQNGNFLNNSVLIVMSDHGMRIGGIRTTFQGKVEENMPLLYAVFPPWFKHRYSKAVDNFIQNGQKLTTPFDIHETLKDLLNLNEIENNQIQTRQKSLANNFLPRGMSLFLEIPSNRTCEDAAIPDSYCVCHAMRSVSIESRAVVRAVEAAVASLNVLLEPYPQCARLQLNETVAAHSVELRANSTDLLKIKRKEFVVVFKTEPGDALFEATVVSHRRKNVDGSRRNWTVAGDISRINEYGNQSHCVDEATLKKYCYC